MIQVILLFPLLFVLTRKYPNLTLICCLILYFIYQIIMCFGFPNDLYDVTSPGGILNKWTVFRFIFLIESAIYFYHKQNKIKWWVLALLMLVDIVPAILIRTTDLPTLYTRGVPYYFIAIAVSGLCIKYLGNLSFGKLNKAIAYCGNATWHIFSLPTIVLLAN